MALNLRTSLIVDPPDGRLPPLSAEGQRRAGERAAARKSRGGPHDTVQNEPLASRCILMDRNGPPMLAGAYNNDYQIVQAPGFVMILTEMVHDGELDFAVVPASEGRVGLKSRLIVRDREMLVSGEKRGLPSLSPAVSCSARPPRYGTRHNRRRYSPRSIVRRA